MTECASSTDRCPFCLHPESNCQALHDARRTGQIAFARDRAGLAHSVVPVRLAGRPIAFLLAGQVFDTFPEQLLLDDLARKTGCAPHALWEIARREVPVGRTVLQAYAELLSTLAESYVQANHAGIVDRQRYAEILGLHADLAERKQIESVLREADRRKDEFLATLAHELRNPLSPMMTAVHLLQSNRTSEQTAGRALATLSRQMHHMVRLIDDLLDFSRITRGHIDLQRQCVPLSDVVAAAVETSRPEIDQKRHALVIEDHSDGVSLNMDPVRISQALANLLTNAARYMEPGGEITLTVTRDGEDVVIGVADHGIGIAPDLIERVFDMFVRGSESGTTAPGGLGIGLTLAKMLVEMHGGTIAVRSEGRDRGTEFTIRLPAAHVEDTDIGGHEREPVPAVPTARRRILIVEDNDDSREMLTEVLGLKGHEVRSVNNGRNALEAVETWRPDVVILDIGLPDMNGHEVARRLRERADLRDVVLVALTGWGQEQDRQRSSAAGIQHHLTKPLDPDKLDQLLGVLMKH